MLQACGVQWNCPCLVQLVDFSFWCSWSPCEVFSGGTGAGQKCGGECQLSLFLWRFMRDEQGNPPHRSKERARHFYRSNIPSGSNHLDMFKDNKGNIRTHLTKEIVRKSESKTLYHLQPIWKPWKEEHRFLRKLPFPAICQQKFVCLHCFICSSEMYVPVPCHRKTIGAEIHL